MIPWSYNHRTYHHPLKHLEVSIEPPTNIDRSIRTSYANRFILSLRVTPGQLYFLVLGLKISNIHWSILKIEDQPVQWTYQIVTAKIAPRVLYRHLALAKICYVPRSADTTQTLVVVKVSYTPIIG